ncbi:MAG: PKD-like family lipoprotein [Prevotella sp.]|nr:PKD-like family lipoprotein [Prevotella sp.]MDY3851721.1 PKD-like family lipoprotein [Prevotella sp.]
MKKVFMPLLASVLLLGACTDDDSTYGVQGKNYIHLSGLENSYDIVSFSGDKLNISPVVESDYAADDLEYTWSYYNTADGDKSKYDATTGTFTYTKADTISHDKNLSWPVAVTDGQYTLILTVKSKSTGLSEQMTTQVNASSALSLGFYVLKENAEGNTDVDLYNTVSQKLTSDVIKTFQGQAIPGKPRWMDVNHQLAFADPVTGGLSGGNLLCITTENNEVRWIRALDCTTVMDATNNHYAPVAGEIPYRTVRGYFTAYFLTNNGVYTTYTASQNSTGIFGPVAGTGGSTHVVGGTGNTNYYSIVYWSEQTRRLEMLDYNGNLKPVNQDGIQLGTLNYDCLDCGLSTAGGDLMYFVFADRTDATKKYLYQITPSLAYADVTNVRTIDPESHFAKASLRAFNGQQATIAYALDAGKVYSYNLATVGVEKELTFPGLPAGETITFLSNRYFAGSAAFDYLVVGTQSGGTYKLYFYNMVGGEPSGNAQFTITGSGKLKSLGYINPKVGDMSKAAAMPVLDE